MPKGKKKITLQSSIARSNPSQASQEVEARSRGMIYRRVGVNQIGEEDKTRQDKTLDTLCLVLTL